MFYLVEDLIRHLLDCGQRLVLRIAERHLRQCARFAEKPDGHVHHIPAHLGLGWLAGQLQERWSATCVSSWSIVSTHASRSEERAEMWTGSLDEWRFRRLGSFKQRLE